jgi:hypothetical protein
VLKEKPLSELVGLWSYDVDRNWTIRLNGHPRTIQSIPPYHLAIYFNGFPAGIISPLNGGLIAGGAAANEDRFLAAVAHAIEHLAQGELSDHNA